MAQLPSGRHVAIQSGPLMALIDRALQGNCVITRLLRIRQREHLHPYVDVIYFRPAPAGPALRVAPGGLPVPPGLEPCPSGFTLATIGADADQWSQADRTAFREYLASERVVAHLDALLDEVRRVCRLIAESGSFETRLQALMWETDCHPVQVADDEDPMFDLLEDPYDPNVGRE